MKPDISTLFQQASIDDLHLPNRLAVAPMTRVTATSAGVPTEKMARYYSRFARGGFGLVITEGTFIDEAWSQTYACQPGLANSGQAEGWKQVVDAVHSAGAKVIAQIQHAGALSQGNAYRNGTIAPSAVRPKGEQMKFYRGEGPYALPRAMTDEEIADIIESFGSAASRAVNNAGFDGVEIHGANGYLLDQFITDYTNLRTDRWGGDIAARMGVVVDVAKRVRATLGNGVPVGMRISQGKVNDFFHKWPEREQAAEVIFGNLVDAGVGYIHVTEYEAWKPAFGGIGMSLAALARKHAPGVTVIANGSLHDTVQALDLASTDADVIALGRGALSNPDWPQKLCGNQAMEPFEPEMLTPLADLKQHEFAA
ncbi:NADH:flavin oxidoreductase [Paraburkholderia tropica]|uniref:oxidoreductase n=1 Tax=Paraburkholderia tropica TaxID=92647 RepID=UPI001CB4AF27|nr:NADH:flavin oxidoreductase [Paraburkholderia tropica]CAG9234298.1 NADH:flavin oxidoreductase [Paraburkholderia tropica]